MPEYCSRFKDPKVFRQHVKDKHGINVGFASSPSPKHNFYCNDCENTDGHSRRFGTIEHLIDHLDEYHKLDD